MPVVMDMGAAVEKVESGKDGYVFTTYVCMCVCVTGGRRLKCGKL